MNIVMGFSQGLGSPLEIGAGVLIEGSHIFSSVQNETRTLQGSPALHAGHALIRAHQEDGGRDSGRMMMLAILSQ